ncbi:MAG: hypothetical protein ACI8PZ_007264, partial [Myxococcota bacterium]
MTRRIDGDPMTRCSTALVLLVLGCAGDKTADSAAPTSAATPPGTDTHTPSTTSSPTAPLTACEVEAWLADEQAALGLSMPTVCADLVDLGDQTLIGAGLVPPGTDFGAVLGPDAMAHRSEFEDPRRLWRYGDATISVASGGTSDTEFAVLTAQALARLQTDFPDAAAWLDELRAHPTDPLLDCCSWRN